LLDLYIVASGSQLHGENQKLLDLLYINQRNGSFELPTDQLPDHKMNRSVVCGLDFVANGSTDLLVGGRSVPWAYGQLPNHLWLNNNGVRYFNNVT